MAVGVLHTLKEAGVRVGDDVSLVFFDDPPWAELTDPPLTTLGQPVRAMADAAVELLLAPARARPQTSQGHGLRVRAQRARLLSPERDLRRPQVSSATTQTQ